MFVKGNEDAWEIKMILLPARDARMIIPRRVRSWSLSDLNSRSGLVREAKQFPDRFSKTSVASHDPPSYRIRAVVASLVTNPLSWVP